MTTRDRAARVPRGARLPADDPTLFELDLAGLAARWAEAMDRAPITAAEMTGLDAKARRLGMSGGRLMEHAGTAVAAAARALIAAAQAVSKASTARAAGAPADSDRPEPDGADVTAPGADTSLPPSREAHPPGPVLILCGPGNNGG